MTFIKLRISPLVGILCEHVLANLNSNGTTQKRRLFTEVEARRKKVFCHRLSEFTTVDTELMSTENTLFNRTFRAREHTACVQISHKLPTWRYQLIISNFDPHTIFTNSKSLIEQIIFG